MSTQAKIPALLVAPRGSLQPVSGGLQIFTREQIEVIRAAGFDLTIVPFDVDMRWMTRLRRRFFPRPYANVLPAGLAEVVVAEQRRTASQFVFFNVEETADIAAELRAPLAGVARIVLLSAGLNSVDGLHSLRGLGRAPGRSELSFLGRQLMTEMTHRQFLDQVVCLAPFEVEIERWLGSRQVDWLPRTVPDRALAWRPLPGRLGCVSTLNHYPNMEGLTLFLDEFARVAPAGARFRLVGGPRPEGDELARSNPCLDYLGPLDDEALVAEAATWNCFVHPLFYYARGCSTKLAVALGWRLPVATTLAGMRGYRWREGSLPTAEGPRELAALACRLLDPAAAQEAREQIRVVADSSPTVGEVAAKLRAVLLGHSGDATSHHCPDIPTPP